MKIKILTLISLILCFATPIWAAQKISEYMQKPKLMVVLVVDQMRADYLTRFYDRFQPAQKNGKAGGFRYLMEKGAYFPFAEYQVLQNMTCPGHAMISTGSEPHNTGISLNDWFDRDLKKTTYCVDDEQDGLSPRRLKTTTFSDEFKNTSANAKIFSISLKDRSAIMLGGHRANLALWLNVKTGAWETSRYYSQNLPSWATAVNSQIQTLKLNRNTLLEPLGVTITMDLAIEALKGEQLGRHQGTDFLFVSLSSHDMVGHAFGMHSSQIEKMTLIEDQQISRFLQEIEKAVGLKNTVIALTADHGIPPNVETIESYKMESGKLDYPQIFKKANQALNEKFGKSEPDSWIIASKSLHLYLNQKLIMQKKLTAEEVERTVKLALKNEKGILEILTRSQIEKKDFPIGFERLIMASIVDSQWGDLVIIPEPFFMEKGDALVTHMTHYSYDKTVPLIIAGSRIKAGVYSQKAMVLDLAPTLSFILGSMPPVKNNGRVLNEIF